MHCIYCGEELKNGIVLTRSDFSSSVTPEEDSMITIYKCPKCRVSFQCVDGNGNEITKGEIMTIKVKDADF